VLGSRLGSLDRCACITSRTVATANNIAVEQGWRTILRARAQMLYKFRKKKNSRAHENFEQQNKVLEPPIVIINYCIIINAYYNYIA